MRCNLLLIIAIFSLMTATHTTAQTSSTLPLYKGIVPNSTHAPDTEKTTGEGLSVRIENVSIPTLTVYRPALPNGMSVIICPGGGYKILAFQKEGTLVAEMLSQWGITAYVLKYRIPDSSMQPNKSMAPLQDAQQAIRIARQNAARWGLRTNRIGIMGFSAGGHLAATTSTHFDVKADPQNTDTTSARPDFSMLIYPVISFDSTITHRGSRTNLAGNNADAIAFFSNETQITAQTPPAFLVHAGDDNTVPVANALRYYEACLKNKVPAEMHLYPKGGHGFGLQNKTTTDVWSDRLKNWLQTLQ